jgi:hypothetical protein
LSWCLPCGWINVPKKQNICYCWQTWINSFTSVLLFTVIGFWPRLELICNYKKQNYNTYFYESHVKFYKFFLNETDEKIQDRRVYLYHNIENNRYLCIAYSLFIYSDKKTRRIFNI